MLLLFALLQVVIYNNNKKTRPLRLIKNTYAFADKMEYLNVFSEENFHVGF